MLKSANYKINANRTCLPFPPMLILITNYKAPLSLFFSFRLSFFFVNPQWGTHKGFEIEYIMNNKFQFKKSRPIF